MKPETYFVIGFITYLATIALNRFLGERNFKTLTPEEKLRLTEAFSGTRSLSTYGSIAILLALVAVVYFFPASFKVAAPIACGLTLLFTVQLQVSIVRRLRSLAISEQYVSRFRVQSTLVQLGNLVSLSLLALAFIARLS